MGGQQILSLRDRAARERRAAKRWRGISVAMFVVAAVLVALGVIGLVATGRPVNLITISSALIIASSGFSVRTSALSRDHTARRCDRLADASDQVIERGGF